MLSETILDRREQINAEAAPFAGRIAFHVNLDVNVSMARVVATVEPCTDPLCSAQVR